MADIRKLTPELLGEFCRLWNETWPNSAQSPDQIVRDDAEVPAHCIPDRWIAFEDGFAVGFAECGIQIGGSAERAILSVGVSPAFRGKGYGTALFDIAISSLPAKGATRVTVQIREDEPTAAAFAANRGFVEIKHDFESILDLSAVNVEDLAPTTIAGVVIETMAEADSAEFRRAFHALFESIRVDIPRSDPPEPMEFDLFDRLVLSTPLFSWTGSFVALADGNPVGLSGVYRSPTPGRLDQWLTATERPWRGRGIARALKAQVIRAAKEAGFLSLRTDNDSRNLTMLAINDRMGFARQTAMVTLRKDLD